MSQSNSSWQVSNAAWGTNETWGIISQFLHVILILEIQSGTMKIWQTTQAKASITFPLHQTKSNETIFQQTSMLVNGDHAWTWSQSAYPHCTPSVSTCRDQYSDHVTIVGNKPALQEVRQQGIIKKFGVGQRLTSTSSEARQLRPTRRRYWKQKTLAGHRRPGKTKSLILRSGISRTAPFPPTHLANTRGWLHLSAMKSKQSTVCSESINDLSCLQRGARSCSNATKSTPRSEERSRTLC